MGKGKGSWESNEQLFDTLDGPASGASNAPTRLRALRGGRSTLAPVASQATDQEVERMSGELATILDHIDKIGELDLDDVEPTSHVIQVENVLRPDEPRPSMPREEALAQAPDPAEGGFRVPSPGGA